MTNGSHALAVVAAHLPLTDRRALSQAWYSALHLAHPAARPVRAPHARFRDDAPPAARRASAAHPPAARTRSLPVAAQRRRSASAARTEAAPRPPRSDLARRLERGLAELHARRLQPAAHTVDVGGGRVRLIVHGDGRTLRVVALCPRGLREPVERALAGARIALAAHGVAVKAT